MISAATIPSSRPAAMSSAFWRATSVRTFKDIARDCPCSWAMTFERKRPSGWELARPWAGCPYHGTRAGQ